ncbi:IspD/TarI family cytidylyltransferase [Streptococcus sp. DD04]|uniref:IspD/TarI family cytidylyltransferase n=1 Tax=Streptococcus sp. DD04 TaxID=1776578 RepID=UPI0007838563|nr:IspD/TarI family cytidylyltransferase [Streptococcus sp. DD04]KXT63569.1 2-C-methyl-D-erythritol 4-phosphate cytidylyltransferase [Streptococcus sp. DD04]
MNIAIIFAGGTGQRMNSKTKPKQFLELHGKPILIYTLEQFQRHEQIDAIVLVCLSEWKDYCQGLIEKFKITKVCSIVSGGATGQESIFNGLDEAFKKFPEDSIVLIHDGVRPLINAETISKDIECVQKNRSAITVSVASETISLRGENDTVGKIIDRSQCQIAKAPQCFILKDIYQSHLKAQEQGINDFIDSASLMSFFGYTLHTVEGPSENIKITFPSDYYVFRAILEAKENSQIFGI